MPRISALILGLSLAAGCSKTSPDTAPPEHPRHDEVVEGESAVGAGEADTNSNGQPLRVTGVYLDPALTAVCDLQGVDGLFKLDAENKTNPEADMVLNVVVDCVKNGALKGRRIELVGHAARDDEFTRSFGKSRADAVKDMLLADGLDPHDLVTHTSDPEDDPDAASEWPSARRVDVRVATRHAK